MKEVVRLHGVPVSIVYDRDPRFTSNFWKSLQAALGARLDFNTTFHPQIDGQIKQLNQILEDMLRAYAIEFSGNVRCKDLEFETGVKVFLKVVPMKGILRFGRKGKLPEIHWTFQGLGTNQSHVVDFEPLQLNDNFSYEEKPVEILAREVKTLRNREIAFVKVLWQNHQFKEAIWDRKDEMKAQYSELFQE
ncbi:uncharacterized protein LOC120068958 [Benincasa hispida]|uniref:uncharacterized protein LOC120068958 n=1 Tax=Benincasa hispida TaxID=102211 RepID=UPI001900737E|nr:uncharacterized protein LOC120068958 [Benincasa hispida]